MKIKISEIASREEWLSHRLKNVGCSEAPALFGEHPFVTPFKLAAIKKGLFEVSETKRMRFGTLMQGPAIELYREEHPEHVVIPNISFPIKYYEDCTARLGATPDAFVYKEGPRGAGAPLKGIMQIKSVLGRVFKEKWIVNGAIAPPMYCAIQASLEAVFTGADFALLAAIVVDYAGAEFYAIDVPVMPKLYKKAAQLSKLFWAKLAEGQAFQPDYAADAELIKALYPSVTEGKVIDLSGDNSFCSLAAEDSELALVEKRTLTARKSIRTEALLKMGDAEIALVNGEVYATKKRIDVKESFHKAYSFPKITFKKATEV